MKKMIFKNWVKETAGENEMSIIGCRQHLVNWWGSLNDWADRNNVKSFKKIRPKNRTLRNTISKKSSLRGFRYFNGIEIRLRTEDRISVKQPNQVGGLCSKMLLSRILKSLSVSDIGLNSPFSTNQGRSLFFCYMMFPENHYIWIDQRRIVLITYASKFFHIELPY